MAQRIPIVAAIAFALACCSCSVRYHGLRVGDSVSHTFSCRVLDDSDVGGMTVAFPYNGAAVDTLMLGDVRSHVNVEAVKAASEGVVKGLIDGAVKP